jgi:hypothetical protein
MAAAPPARRSSARPSRQNSWTVNSDTVAPNGKRAAYSAIVAPTTTRLNPRYPFSPPAVAGTR